MRWQHERKPRDRTNGIDSSRREKMMLWRSMKRTYDSLMQDNSEEPENVSQFAQNAQTATNSKHSGVSRRFKLFGNKYLESENYKQSRYNEESRNHRNHDENYQEPQGPEKAARRGFGDVDISDFYENISDAYMVVKMLQSERQEENVPLSQFPIGTSEINEAMNAARAAEDKIGDTFDDFIKFSCSTVEEIGAVLKYAATTLLVHNRKRRYRDE